VPCNPAGPNKIRRSRGSAVRASDCRRRQPQGPTRRSRTPFWMRRGTPKTVFIAPIMTPNLNVARKAASNLGFERPGPPIGPGASRQPAAPAFLPPSAKPSIAWIGPLYTALCHQEKTRNVEPVAHRSRNCGDKSTTSRISHNTTSTIARGSLVRSDAQVDCACLGKGRHVPFHTRP